MFWKISTYVTEKAHIQHPKLTLKLGVDINGVDGQIMDNLDILNFVVYYWLCAKVQGNEL